MLSKDQAIYDIDFSRRLVRPDRLTRHSHAAYQDYAEQMLDLYREGKGRTRIELHQAVERIFDEEPNCPARRIAAFCKILDDLSSYDQGATVDAARLRKSVFRSAARHHPLVSKPDKLFASDRVSVREQIARELGRSWNEIDQDLFADVIDFHRLLESPASLSAGSLLARYNVAQTQVALFDATALTVWCETDFSAILKTAKLAGLMHTVVRQSDGVYCIRLDGPASLSRETRRYGTSMAKFLPTLIACGQWKLQAMLKLRNQSGVFQLQLNSSDGLTSHVESPSRFDSDLERKLAEKWGMARRNGWRLDRESMLMHQNQKVFTPDFCLEHQSGISIAVEIVGFWTPDYLMAKLETLRLFASQRIILAVQEKSASQMKQLKANESIRIVTYKTAIRPEALEEAAEQFLDAT